MKRRHQPTGQFAVVTLVAGLLVGCTPAEILAPPVLQPPPQPFPANCSSVAAGAPLQPRLDAAKPGDNLCLADGEWTGAIVIPDGIGLYGGARSILHTNRVGTTVLMKSKTTLRGLVIDGSGDRFDVLDSAVKIHGDDVLVEGVTIRNSAFGILAEKSHRATIRYNRVLGVGGPALGMRGDGIRLWETNDSLVEHNRVSAVRDCVVWYSSRNMLRDNLVEDSRYGVHFMYSHDNKLEHNQFRSNEVGVFAMYSRNLQLTSNAMLFSRGAAGIGIGVKESGNLTVRGNLLAHNTQGIFVDNSPLNVGDTNLFEDNIVRLSTIGVGFLSAPRDNTFRRNTFKDNTTQVRVDGGGDAMAITWTENDWSDYAGYDLDGDGIGDLPYELRDLSDALVSRNADLEFLRGTPALALVSVAGDVVPMFAPKPVLRDLKPRFGARSDHAR